MKKILDGKVIVYFEYIFIFIGLCVAFFFMIPQSDVFLFARDSQPTLMSVFNHALFYGNGRLLGNLIGMGFSHIFEYAFLLVALSFTALIGLINNLLFNNNKVTVFLIALLISFPSSNMISEVHYLFASFTNYVLPCVFMLVSVKLNLYLTSKSRNPIACVSASAFMFLTCLASCLFNENSTLFVLAFAVLQSIYYAIEFKRINIYHIIYLISAIIGTLGMFFIPKFTGTADRMDHYRSTEITVSRIFANFLKLTEVLCNISWIMVCVSLALIYLCLKKTGINRNVKVFQVVFFAFFTFGSVVLSDFDFRDLYISRLNIVPFAAITVYIILAIWIIFSVKDKSLRMKLVFFGMLICASFVPMLVVTQYGYRTFYLTSVVLLVFSFYVLNNAISELSTGSFSVDKKVFKKSVVMCSMATFMMLSGYVFLQSVYNYNYYVLRTQLIEQQVEATPQSEEDFYLESFTLPCEGISIEDEFVDLLLDIIPISRSANNKTIGIFDSGANDRVYEILENSFLSNLCFALDNLEYKDPLILTK